MLLVVITRARIFEYFSYVLVRLISSVPLLLGSGAGVEIKNLEHNPRSSGWKGWRGGRPDAREMLHKFSK